MSEFIEKKVRSAKILRICIIIIFILWISSFLLFSLVEPEILTAPVMLLTTGMWVSVIIYFAVFFPMMSGYKWLESKGLENIADDILLEQPTLPRSKIYCGQRALFSKKPCSIIPYSEIAWVHLYERRSYGITVEKAVIVYTKDGKKFKLNADADEFKWLLENYIVKNSPNVVIGYGAEQKKRYKDLNPEFAEAGKKVKRTWGIALMCVGAAFLAVAIINIKNVQLVPLSILILALLGTGTILFVLGRKR